VPSLEGIASKVSKAGGLTGPKYFQLRLMDGVLQLTAATTVMTIDNPDDLMNFYLDNLEGIGTGEFANGQIGLLRVYDGVLADDTVAALAKTPFGN
jgi:hypothetical protein